MAGEALNRCWFTTTSTGTGDLAMGAAVTDAVNGDYFTPAQAGMPAATRRVSYVLTRGNDTEIGTADYNGSTNTLVRSTATVTLSKIAGTAGTSKLNLAAGTSRVMLTWIAEDLRTPTISETKPATPSQGVALWVRNMAGRRMLGWVRSDGDTGLASPHWARNRISMSVPQGASASAVANWGIIAPTLTGGTSRSVATTNFFVNQKRVGHVTAATAAASAGAIWATAQFSRGGAAGVGGFHMVLRFGLSHAAAVAQGRFFFGLQPSTTQLGNIALSTLLNCIGIGFESAATVFSIIHNDNLGVSVNVPLSANFPTGLGAAGSVNWYEAQFFCLPNAVGDIGYRIERLDPANNFVAEGTLNANLPQAGTMLVPTFWVNNGTTAAVMAADWSMMYIEMDN